MNSFEYGRDFFKIKYVFPFRGFVNKVLFCCRPLITDAFPYHSQCLGVWWHVVSRGIYSEYSCAGGAIRRASICSVKMRLTLGWPVSSVTGCRQISSFAFFRMDNKLSIIQQLHSSLMNETASLIRPCAKRITTAEGKWVQHAWTDELLKQKRLVDKKQILLSRS